MEIMRYWRFNMDCFEAVEHVNNLRMLKEVYNRLLKDPYKSLYENSELKKLIKMTQEEIENTLSLMDRMELSDSYDQNTGKIHQLYKV